MDALRNLTSAVLQSADKHPYLLMVRSDNSTNATSAAPSEIVSFHIILKIASLSQAAYNISVTSQSSSGQNSVCYIKLVRAGRNIACFDSNQLAEIKSTPFTTGHTLLRESMLYSVGVLANSGSAWTWLAAATP